MASNYYTGSRVCWEDISETKVFMCDLSTPVPEMAAIMVDHWIDTIFVVNEKEELLGVVTDGVILSLVANGEEFEHLTAADIMSKHVYSVKAKDPIISIEKLKEGFSKKHNRVNRVAIINDAGKLAGVVSLAFLEKVGRFSRSFEINLKARDKDKSC